MKTDSLFYYIFLNFPHIFFELIDQANTDIDTYEFTSREVKQLSFRLDGLFLPTENNYNQPFYLVEVQFQPDDNLYYRLFAELFLFLRQYQPPYPWRIVVIYPTRKVEREENHQFGDFLALNRVQRIYLDELEETITNSLGIRVVKLIIEPENEAVNLAKSLVSQTKEEITDSKIQQNLIDLITKIIVDKLPQKSREEIQAMLGLSDLKRTKFYQEAFAEGKEESNSKSVSNMIRLGLNLETIAKYLDLSLDEVQRLAKQNQKRD